VGSGMPIVQARRTVDRHRCQPAEHVRPARAARAGGTRQGKARLPRRSRHRSWRNGLKSNKITRHCFGSMYAGGRSQVLTSEADCRRCMSAWLVAQSMHRTCRSAGSLGAPDCRELNNTSRRQCGRLYHPASCRWPATSTDVAAARRRRPPPPPAAARGPPLLLQAASNDRIAVLADHAYLGFYFAPFHPRNHLAVAPAYFRLGAGHHTEHP
jgi:hypothetical protein